jgi:hypothetical protein
VAQHKDYGLVGVGNDVQLGKQGPILKNNGDGTLSVTDLSGVNGTQLSGANAINAADFVTKAQLDALASGVGTDGFSFAVGNISADGDGSWTDGAVQTITNTTTVSQAIDDLNEAMENVRNDTFVKSVDFTTDKTSGGNPLTATLTITAVGNADRYTIDWGDGSNTTATADSTPSHTYTDDTNSPYDITVTAFNNAGTGTGSSATKEKVDLITLYTATPVADFELYSANIGGSELISISRELDAGETIWLENTTTNSSTANCTFEIDWGDGSANTSVVNDSAGDVGFARVNHTYAADSGSSTYTITMQQTAHNTADPNEVGSTTTEIVKVYDSTISAPAGLSSKTLTFGETSTGSSPYLASGFTNRSTESTLTAGSSVTRITGSSAGGTISSGTLSSYAYNADSGELQAILNGTSVIGNVTLTSGSQTGTYSRTGAFNGLTIDAESDYQLLSSSGSGTSFTNSIYSPGLYKGFKATMYLTTSIYQNHEGVYTFKLSHSETGDTNVVQFVLDDLTSTPTVDFTGATLSQASTGTLAYESGIPYYTNNAILTLSGTQVYNWIGQTYRNDSAPFDIENGTNFESTTGRTISAQGFSYAQIDGASTFLNGGIPVADTGKSSANKYTLGSITINVNGNGTGVEQIKAKMDNVNGTGSYTEFTDVKVQALNSSSGVNETIPVADALGATHDDDGVRITGFSMSADTPAFDNSVNNYTANVWSGAETISGTAEAVTRFGTLSHYTTDLSSGYLPAGPDLATGRSGAQYFTFAFRRTTMSNFDITLTGTVSGLWVAAPGTNIDSASGLNGWLDAGTTYGGAGTPGSDIGAGGNGSDGCAFTSGDRIVDGTAYSNDSFTMTLGDQNATNSTGNNILVRIKLEDGDSLTALSIS